MMEEEIEKPYSVRKKKSILSKIAERKIAKNATKQNVGSVLTEPRTSPRDSRSNLLKGLTSESPPDLGPQYLEELENGDRGRSEHVSRREYKAPPIVDSPMQISPRERLEFEPLQFVEVGGVHPSPLPRPMARRSRPHSPHSPHTQKQNGDTPQDIGKDKEIATGEIPARESLPSDSGPKSHQNREHASPGNTIEQAQERRRPSRPTDLHRPTDPSRPTDLHRPLRQSHSSLNVSDNALPSNYAIQTDGHDSGSDSDEKLAVAYQSMLETSPPKYELTRENVAKIENESKFDSHLRRDSFDKYFTRTSRSQRVTNFTRAASLTPLSDTYSTRSCATHSSLSMIPTRTVRERSYLAGSIGSGALLGTDDLERLFPDRKIKVFVVTWNVHENAAKNLPQSLDEILLPEQVEYMPDICVVVTQESCSDKREWEIRLQETIGPTHVLFHSTFHGDLHTCVFIRRDLIWYCSVPEEYQVTCHATVRTKGSLAVSFSVFGTSFLFLNSHFISGDGKLGIRIEDYKETITGIKLPRKPARPFPDEAAADVTARFDVTFWGGDMNFRIDRPRHIVDTIIRAIQDQQPQHHPDYAELLVGCELYRCRNEGLIFEKFQEGRINFPPTYKYDVNKDHLYDTTSKMRIPSYCDRILFRSKKKEGVVCQYYSSIDSVKVSDHHPVFGLYDVDVRPGLDSIELAAGRFNREVFIEAANRRRMRSCSGPTSGKAEKSSICVIS